MNFDRWFELIYTEKDFGRSIATAIAGVAGLGWYLFDKDWVVAAFIAIIVFPPARILASFIRDRLIQKRGGVNEQYLKNLFENLGSEERATVVAFVYFGDIVMKRDQINATEVGIESLIHRGLVQRSIAYDSMDQILILNSQIFNYARKIIN